MYFSAVSDVKYYDKCKGGDNMQRGNTRIALRLDVEMVERLKRIGQDMGMSLSELIREVLQDYLDGE